jgi:hypothetical protein
MPPAQRQSLGTQGSWPNAVDGALEDMRRALDPAQDRRPHSVVMLLDEEGHNTAYLRARATMTRRRAPGLTAAASVRVFMMTANAVTTTAAPVGLAEGRLVCRSRPE